MLEKLFNEIDISENAHQIYIQLLENGPTSARVLAENIGLPRPTTYDALKSLIQKGLVIERKENNKKIFQLDDVKNLPRLINGKIDALDEAKKDFEKMLPQLMKKTTSIEPKIKFYSGVEGVRQVMNDMLWYHDIDTCAMWAVSEILDYLGKDFTVNLNRRRIRQKIYTRAIWPTDKKVDIKRHPYLGTGPEFYREIRIAPPNISWDMSYWIYADKVAFISSRKETFGFVIHSRDFARLIKTQFELVWKISKKLKPEPEYAKEFLKTV
jgi:sugar-specific transcriptional regulator TrmB